MECKHIKNRGLSFDRTYSNNRIRFYSAGQFHCSSPCDGWGPGQLLGLEGKLGRWHAGDICKRTVNCARCTTAGTAGTHKCGKERVVVLKPESQVRKPC